MWNHPYTKDDDKQRLTLFMHSGREGGKRQTLPYAQKKRQNQWKQSGLDLAAQSNRCSSFLYLKISYDLNLLGSDLGTHLAIPRRDLRLFQHSNWLWLKAKQASVSHQKYLSGQLCKTEEAVQVKFESIYNYKSKLLSAWFKISLFGHINPELFPPRCYTVTLQLRHQEPPQQRMHLWKQKLHGSSGLPVAFLSNTLRTHLQRFRKQLANYIFQDTTQE